LSQANEVKSKRTWLTILCLLQCLGRREKKAVWWEYFRLRGWISQKDYREQPVIGALEDLVAAGEIELIVPQIVVDEFNRNRSGPGDYDEWGQLGAEGWSWDACLPYFRKLERDIDFDGAYRGKDGPIPIRRISDQAMSPFVKAVCKTLQDRGYPASPTRTASGRMACSSERSP
jgi:hypothetical protein